LKAKGFKVSAIKIDPYLNYDAGTLRPTEHGEVWVTEDGGEIDQDLGHYERFMDITLTQDHNITSGKIYYNVISKERRGEYLGQTVQPIPHVTDEIKSWILRVAEYSKTDFMLIEIGGVVGDYENILFLEAVRQLKLERPQDLLFIHVVYLPVPRTLGEMKTKPVQHSVKLLREIGIQPDFIIARSEYELDDVRRRKISLFCSVDENDIISDPDLENIYELPLIFDKEGLGDKILKKFSLDSRSSNLEDWRRFVESLNNAPRHIRIAIVGKYFSVGKYRLPDSYISVIEAIRHASAHHGVRAEIDYIDSEDFERDPDRVRILSEYNGIIVPGGFGKKGVEGKILAIKYARENGIPFLGLCFGLQLAVVEFARNVCGLEGANSTEIDEDTPHPVVDLLPQQREIIREGRYGATMRLGGHKVIIKKGSLAYSLYNRDVVVERFRHRYEINPDYVPILEEGGFSFSGESEDGIKQIGELPTGMHPFFIGSQFHPEFTSRPLKPNPLFKGFVKASMEGI
jgi:CTP synthase